MPNRRINGVVAGLMVRFPANSAATITPAASGVQPNCSWNCNGSRNGTAVITNRYSDPATTVMRSVCT